MKGIQHKIFSIFMYLLALLGVGLIAWSDNLLIPGAFIIFFFGSIGWYQWQLGEHGTGAISSDRKKTRSVFQKIFGIILIVLSIIFAVMSEGENTALIAVAAFILVFGILEYRGSSDKMYNKDTDGLMRIDSLEVPMEKIYADFKEIDTPLGKPWLTHVSTITDRDCIVWGPAKNGSFVFGYYLAGTFNFSHSESISWIRDKEAAQAHQHEAANTIDPKVKSAVLEDIMIKLCVKMYEQMLRNYGENGQAKWPYPKLTNFFDAKLYVFDASFSWTGSVYHLLDINGNAVYDIEGKIPLTTFRVSDSVTGEEIFKIKKDITKPILNQYEFLYKGEDFGKMKQELDLYHDYFVLESPMGNVVLRSINATVGKNWVVLVNDMIVGTISKKLNLNIRDFVFDNYAVMCYDEEYLPILAGLAIMGEREAVRDDEQNGISN